MTKVCCREVVQGVAATAYVALITKSSVPCAPDNFVSGFFHNQVAEKSPTPAWHKVA
jgi:hypothetical protein